MRTVANLLNTIRAENPSYWPNGLSIDQFDGGLYLVKAGSDPVGFVGWQERDETGKRVGYYSVGVLKEHRRQGIAKEALQQMLSEKSAGVDEVRALVMANNEPSKQLARSLRVRLIEKRASPVAQRVGAAVGGLVTPVLMDQLLHPEVPVSDSLQPWKWDKFRMINGLLNATFGAAGGHRLGAGDMTGFIPIGMAPTKDLAMKGLGSLHKMDQLVDPAAKALDHSTAAIERPKIPVEVLLGALGLGAGALGVAAYSAKRKSDAAASSAQAQREGRVKVTLPTRNPNDAETVLDLPLTDISMSNAMRMRLKRDTKRRLYSETTERTRLRKPKHPDNPTAAEQEAEALRSEIEEDNAKAAAAQPPGPPNPGVPSPPQLGVNPAMRLQGQRTAVQSIDTSTDANPQIMKAQQEAMAAKQEAQMQSAQSQQQQAQAQMESDAAHQQELAKATSQNQMLQMKLEQEKVRNDLVAEKAKAQQQITAVQTKADKAMSGGQASQVDKITQSRLKRIAGKIKAGASDAPKPVLRHDAMQRLNTDGHAYVAQGGIAPVNVWRHSYGKPLDALFSWFAKDHLFRPPASAVQQALPFSTFANHPDKLGILASGVLDRGF